MSNVAVECLLFMRNVSIEKTIAGCGVTGLHASIFHLAIFSTNVYKRFSITIKTRVQKSVTELAD